MSLPQVSVLMAVRDGAAFLPQTLESLGAQTFRDFELIFVDDASEDGSPAIAESFRARGIATTILRNERNLGLAASLNRGLEVCRAPLIARADGDDIYEADRLKRQVSFLGEHPKVGVVSCGYRRIYEDGRFGGVARPLLGSSRIAFALMFITPLLHPGAVFRRDLVRSAGGYDDTLWTAQDSELWLRLRGQTQFANIDAPLVHYRGHADTITRRRGAEGERLSLKIKADALSAWYGENLAEEDAFAAIQLFRSYDRLPQEEVTRGARTLKRLRRHARQREPREVRAYFRRRCLMAYLSQTRFWQQADPAFACALACRAFLRKPGLYAGRILAAAAARRIGM